MQREIMAKIDPESLTNVFSSLVGDSNVLTSASKMNSYCKGFRFGSGEAMAVVRPGTLLETWQVLKACVSGDLAIIMQAANTGLTGGSTPDGKDYDRPVVIINTMRINDIQLIDDAKQIVALPGSTLFGLEEQLKPYGREPHSVIGSSCIGASIVGGVCNNSGGALVQRGPAYTELSLYAKIDEQGNLSLVNNLGINLGNTPEEMLTRLQLRTYPEQAVENTTRRASDNEYHLRVRDVHADTPSRFNNDGRRLYEASGCAGKIAVFAVRLDTYPIAKEQQVFYVGTNDPGTLETMRRGILSTFVNLPVSAEYMHRECYDVSRKYGKDTFWVIDKLGSKYIPLLFSIKRTMDRFAANFKFLPKMLSDILMQYISCLLPNHLPEKMGDYRDRYEHHLILEMSNDGVEEAREYLQKFFCEHEGDFFECTEREGKEAILHRFVAGGAIGRYHIIHANQLGEMMTIDVALRRNEFEWFEQLSPEIDALIENKFYYGHLFCHVMHQNYILKRDVSAKQLKDNLLASFDERRAEYPAEHNVGHEYTAKETLRRFYKELDPSNTFNPGIGKTSKQKDWKIAN